MLGFIFGLLGVFGWWWDCYSWLGIRDGCWLLICWIMLLSGCSDTVAFMVWLFCWGYWLFVEFRLLHVWGD